MSIDNVKLARRWYEEVWNQRRTDTIDELLTDESLGHSDLGVLRGKEEFKQKMHSVFLAAFPDLRVTVEQTIARGDDVVARWLVVGTHHGDGLGLPATGRKVAFRGMSSIRFRDGKLIEGWDFWNLGRLLQTLTRADGRAPRR